MLTFESQLVFLLLRKKRNHRNKHIINKCLLLQTTHIYKRHTHKRKKNSKCLFLILTQK